ncbi:MAG: tetratricopeptide repeat protein [Saprospiraceae bacterium]|jgi:tetratricopeptide (TPR) repeat protein|nr:tetratricopeptide repeat protein [Saprospiraceae bacterium]
MKKNTIPLILITALAACQSGPGKEEMSANIQVLQKEIGAQPQPAPEKLIELQNALVLYADAFPEDSASVKHLVKAGEAARLLQQYDKALEIFTKIEKNYPNSKEAVGAMFMRAFTLDNDLKRLDEAKLAYEAFLKKYPNDDFADDAKFLLGNLGKSPEEIIKGFERDSTQ